MLADYLRARRERLQPEDVGLAVGSGRRRVPGLRRDEVAILAGISTDYYLRLEQGRDVNPSAQVLDALARALQLDSVATGYLHTLLKEPSRPSVVQRSDVSESVRWLIDSWPLTAAVVHSRYIDVLASNALARALNPNYRAGVNGLFTLFTDPAERELHSDWEGLAARSVALLRTNASGGVDDARLASLVDDCSGRSPLFREFWKSQDVTRVGDGTHVLRHPKVGSLTLHYLRLALVGTDGQSIFLYSAEPGTPSSAGMLALAHGG